MEFNHSTFKDVFEAADKVFLSSKQVAVSALRVAAVSLDETQPAFALQNLRLRWRRLKVRMAVRMAIKTRRIKKVKEIKISLGARNIAQSRIVRQMIKCVSAITDMVFLLGTASTPTAALGKTRSHQNEGPADLEK